MRKRSRDGSIILKFGTILTRLKNRSKFEKEINKRKKNAVIISIERIDYE